MTSKPQLNANRSNAKKSTGPKTKSGKSIASSNAVKHGATAKHFIGEAESQAYQAFLAALQKAYPNKNPLVAMQLERIAKIKIQLERIQSTIDATFEMAQEEEGVDAKLMGLLDMDEALVYEAKSIASGDKGMSSSVNHERIKIATELSSVDITELKTQQEFLNQTPLLCEYLFKRSRECAMSILDFIEIYAEKEVKNDHALNRIHAAILRTMAGDLQFDNNIDKAIEEVSVETLRKAAKVYTLEIHRLSDEFYKIHAYSRLREIPHLSIALNLDTLDKLYRYQSTLQRQLSNCIGELLVLNKPVTLSKGIEIQ
ncbi:hypothetical protein MCECM63_00316 [Methylophilaceae bacterium]